MGPEQSNALIEILRTICDKAIHEQLANKAVKTNTPGTASGLKESERVQTEQTSRKKGEISDEDLEMELGKLEDAEAERLREEAKAADHAKAQAMMNGVPLPTTPIVVKAD